MNNEIQKLRDDSQLIQNPKLVMNALTDLGLLVERHTQNRYNDNGYNVLFSNEDLFKLKLTDKEVDSIVEYFFYHIINIRIHPVTTAWALGKCYDYKIYEGLKNLLKLYSHDDDVCEQLLFSLNALYEPKDTFKDIARILEEPIKLELLPKSEKVLKENFELLNNDTD